jgi:L-2-hydroxyglutarate oxidase LhgO
MPSAKVLSYGTLAGDTKADVCVVGAGIAGMTTAYLISRQGKSVVVPMTAPLLAARRSERPPT